LAWRSLAPTSPIWAVRSSAEVALEERRKAPARLKGAENPPNREAACWGRARKTEGPRRRRALCMSPLDVWKATEEDARATTARRRTVFFLVPVVCDIFVELAVEELPSDLL